MIQLYTSYFYQIRFFPPNFIPVSTAKWDPAWYHNWMGPDYVFKDKRGVYNGIRAECFHYDDSEYECECGDRCLLDPKDPSKCSFLRQLRIQYDKLNFEEIMQRCIRLGSYIKDLEKMEELPALVFIFYETPKNPCSERSVLQSWFKDHGYNLKELEYPIKQISY